MVILRTLLEIAAILLNASFDVYLEGQQPYRVTVTGAGSSWY